MTGSGGGAGAASTAVSEGSTVSGSEAITSRTVFAMSCLTVLRMVSLNGSCLAHGSVNTLTKRKGRVDMC